jgi:hypothetical protein
MVEEDEGLDRPKQLLRTPKVLRSAEETAALVSPVFHTPATALSPCDSDPKTKIRRLTTIGAQNII